MHKSRLSISFAGAGNVAWHLACGLKKKGFLIKNIWSKDISNAQSLAERCEAKAVTDLVELQPGSDLIIIAVPDKVIAEVATTIGNFEGIVVHTAGSVTIDVLKNNSGKYGVLYPLQTFSKGVPVDFNEIPFFLESSSDEVLKTLMLLATKLSEKVYQADSHRRMMLHIAGVFAGNYSNLMYTLGNKILENEVIPSDVLHPLILKTAQKAITGDPVKMQTGPARRNDTETIEKHILALASMPEYADLYQLLAMQVSKNYK